MKFNIKSHLLTLAFAIFTLSGALAQAPQAIRYQGIARNTSGDPLISKDISINLSILEDSAAGSSIYQETHKVTTSPLGLYNLSIGTGTPLKGKFSEINWAGGDKFLTQEVNFGSGFEKMGTSQFLSVPFALYAASGNPGPAGTNGAKGADGISIKWMGTLSSPPDRASMNQAYYNSTDKKSYIFNGSIWQILTQDGASGLVPDGAAAGNTPFWNGTEWITNNNNIFNNGGNVGIGKTDPAEKLDVNGNIIIPAANDYKYATSKKKYVSIPAIAFSYAQTTNTSGILAGSNSGTTRYIAGGTSTNNAYLFAPIYLPDGATFTKLNLFAYDNDATYDINANLFRIYLQTNTATNIGSTNFSNGTPTNVTLTSIPFAPIIDNSQYGYYIRVNTMDNNINLKVLGATLEYTINKVD